MHPPSWISTRPLHPARIAHSSLSSSLSAASLPATRKILAYRAPVRVSSTSPNRSFPLWPRSGWILNSYRRSSTCRLSKRAHLGRRCFGAISVKLYRKSVARIKLISSGAIELGLHRRTDEYSSFSAIDVEVRKRTIWAIYAQDIKASCTSGRPPILRLADLGKPSMSNVWAQADLQMWRSARPSTTCTSLLSLVSAYSLQIVPL